MGWLSKQRVIPLDPYGVRSLGNSLDVHPDGTYQNYVKHAYSRNELAYACIAYRAESFAQGQIKVYPHGKSDAQTLDDHELRRLFEQPNPECQEYEFWELSMTYKDIAGTSFWYQERGRNDKTANLWPLCPSAVSASPHPTIRGEYAWIYRPDPQHPDIRVMIDRSDMIRVRYANPDREDPGFRYFGQPPLRAGARAVSLDNAATDFVTTILRNHAVPMVVIETEEEIKGGLYDRLISKWRSMVGGAKRGTPAFLSKGMKIHEIGLSLTNLEFPSLREVSETRICSAFRVEPILVGAKVGLIHNAYKDYREARLSFWEETMMSEQRRFIEPVRTRLHPEHTGRGRSRTRVAWDNSGVLALRESQQAIWDRAVNALARGGITRNDFRSMINLPPVPNGDVFLTPSGVIPEEAGGIVSVDSLSASYGMLASEYGIELSNDELSALTSRGVLEGVE